MLPGNLPAALHKNTLVIICGPTAAGKTDFAIELAKALNTEIISADSRQCFKELNIGVAKPSTSQLAAVPHYFINSHSITGEVNASVFETYALTSAAAIFEKHSTAVMVGGTGLYINAFCNGLDAIPKIKISVREQVAELYRRNGIQYLQQEVRLKDPNYWQVAEQQNPQRLMRALEVFLSTGKSINDFRTGNSEPRPFDIIKIGLELPRELLYERINERVDSMVANGLEQEVQFLLPHRNINALKTVGYREFFDYFDGIISLQKTIEIIKTNTRHYAKRQITWFKKDTGITWFSPEVDQKIIDMTCQMINHKLHL